jgi:hypothetical protein
MTLILGTQDRSGAQAEPVAPSSPLRILTLRERGHWASSARLPSCVSLHPVRRGAAFLASAASQNQAYLSNSFRSTLGMAESGTAFNLSHSRHDASAQNKGGTIDQSRLDPEEIALAVIERKRFGSEIPVLKNLEPRVLLPTRSLSVGVRALIRRGEK